MVSFKKLKLVFALVISTAIFMAALPSIPVRAASTYTVDISQGDIIIARGLTASSYSVSSAAGLAMPKPLFQLMTSACFFAAETSAFFDFKFKEAPR